MSYARFGDGSDVYVYLSHRGDLECCGCILQKSEWIDDPSHFLGGYDMPIEPIAPHRFDSTQGMVDHLAEHRAAGHAVPEGIEAELRADDEENFPAVGGESA